MKKASHSDQSQRVTSTEDRRKKPCHTLFPFNMCPTRLSDSKARNLANNIINEIVKRNMNVASNISRAVIVKCVHLTEILGFMTDREWNTLLIKENSRPLLVFPIHADVTYIDQSTAV